VRNRHALLYTFGVGKLLFQAKACGTAHKHSGANPFSLSLSFSLSLQNFLLVLQFAEVVNK